MRLIDAATPANPFASVGSARLVFRRVVFRPLIFRPRGLAPA